jgi:hypothetical protein
MLWNMPVKRPAILICLSADDLNYRLTATLSADALMGKSQALIGRVLTVKVLGSMGEHERDYDDD